jgi:hypothetical protein
MNYKTVFTISILLLLFVTTIASASFTSYNPKSGNTYWVGADGRKIVLTNNNSAVNPTYAQLIAFLKKDKTDQLKYTSKYKCGDFAETLHNNAEKAGYKAGWICMKSINHAANMFQTKDKGTVYIDCTGVPSSGGKCYDTKVAVKIGSAYKRVPLFCSNVYFGSMGTVKDLKTFW